MICSKCNNEIPDNAKFCPNCGALSEAAAENKSFCSNCGLELPKGAKFCTVCGTPADIPADMPAVSNPSDVMEPVSLSSPVSASQPIDLSKNTSEADKLVSAMSNAVPAPSDYSAPQTAGSMPTAGFIPGEVPAANNPTSGFAAPTTGYSSPAPAYTANNVNPAGNPFGGFDNTAAAVAVTPIKKKSIKKPLIISICSVIGALLIAAGVIFFVNRQFFFTLFLGNSGYAAMVEGNSIRDITSKIDMSAVSESIKSASPSFAAQMSAMSSGYGSSGISLISPVQPLMNSSMSSISNMDSVDLKELIRTYNEALKKSYGSNNAKITMSTSAELTDTAKALLRENGASESDINKLLDMINGMGISSEIIADENAMSMFVEGNADSLKLNCKVVIADNGDVYLQVPFASDKAISINVGTTTAAPSVQDVYLELDEKELKKITDKIVNIYIDAYKSSEVTLEDGEISAGGVKANGKHIKVNLTGDKLTEMFKNIGDAIAEDSYLCGKISVFMTECGAPVSEEQLKSGIKMMFGMMAVPDNCGIVIDTITDSNCRVLAKSYDIVSYGSSAMKFSVVGDLDTDTKNGDKAAFSMDFSGEMSITVTVNKESDTDGDINISLITKGDTIGLNVKYTGIKETTFCGNPAFEGTYEISAVLPKDFTQETDMNMPDEVTELINSAKIIVTSKIDGNTSNGSFIFDFSKYGKISMNMSVTAGDGDKSAEIPSNALDITEYINMEEGEVPESVTNEVIGIVKDMKNAVHNQNAGELGEAVESALEEAIDLAENGPKADPDEVKELIKKINEDGLDVTYCLEVYEGKEGTEEVSEKAHELVDKLRDLLNDVKDDKSNMSQKAFDAYQDRYTELHSEFEAIKNEFHRLDTQTGLGGSSAKNITFSTLEIDELTLVLIEYESRYSEAISSSGNISISNPELEALFDNASKAYETAADDFGNFMDKYNHGSMELGLLRQSRKSAKVFAFAVEELEEALRKNI